MKKPTIVQEQFAELQERFGAAVAAAPQLDLATGLRKFLKDVKKCLEGIIDERALEVMSVALAQARDGATSRPEFWELVPGPVQDSYTPLSALYTKALELVGWVLLCRCENAGMQFTDLQRDEFTNFAEKGGMLFNDSDCKDDWAEFYDQFVQVFFMSHKPCHLDIFNLSRCTQPIHTPWHLVIFNVSRCSQPIIYKPCHLVIYRAILS